MKLGRSLREDFRVEIRNKCIAKHISEIRRELIANRDSNGFEDVAKALRLPFNQEAIPDFIELCLRTRQMQLLHPFDEQPGQEDEERPPAQSLSLESNIQFWAQVVSFLEAQPNRKVLQQLGEFFCEFIPRNKHRIIAARSKEYQNQILHVLELITQDLETMKGNIKLRQRVLEWVRGTEGLVLIHNCATVMEKRQMLSPFYYKNAYRIIELALETASDHKVDEASVTLVRMLRYSDWDDTKKLYMERQSLLNTILTKIRTLRNSRQLDSLTDAVILLLNSYDSVLIDCARAGVGLLGAELATCRIQENQLKGLIFLRILSRVPSKIMIDFLLEDSDIDFTGFWSFFCNHSDFRTHSNLAIRQQYFGILANLLTNGDFESCMVLSRMYKQIDLLDILINTISEVQDYRILLSCLNCLQNLFYYGQVHSPEHNYILHRFIEARGTVILEEIAKHSNEDVSSQASSLLQCIQLQLAEAD